MGVWVVEFILLPLLLLAGFLTTLGGDGPDEGEASENDTLTGDGSDDVVGGDGDDLLSLDDEATG